MQLLVLEMRFTTPNYSLVIVTPAPMTVRKEIGQRARNLIVSIFQFSQDNPARAPSSDTRNSRYSSRSTPLPKMEAAGLTVGAVALAGLFTQRSRDFRLHPSGLELRERL